MNIRERFLGTFEYEHVDRVPDFEFGYWSKTVEKWVKNGHLPRSIFQEKLENQFRLGEVLSAGEDSDLNKSTEKYFGFERRRFVPIHIGLYPPFEREVIEETQDYRLIRNAEGVICKELKDRETMPEWMEFPIKTRSDFRELSKERLDPSNPERYPDNWEELVKEYKNRDYPLGIFCGSLYGWPRNWMGVERLSRKLKRDPDFVEDIMKTLEENMFKVISHTLEKLDEHGVQLDFSAWWEDMCFNKGPLLSPKMFEEFMVPKYKRITELLEDYGISIHYVDCDGKIDDLIPLWLEGGINCMFPVEAAHTPPERIREKFGKDVLMMGGIDKRALIEGTKKAIDEEFEKLPPLLEEGGFIPHVDHRVPADVDFDSYKYYLNKKRKIIGRKTDF